MQRLAEVSGQPLQLPEPPEVASKALPPANRCSEQLLSLPQSPKVANEALPPARRRRGLDDLIQRAARGLLRVAALPPSAAAGESPVDADRHQPSFATMQVVYHSSRASALSQMPTALTHVVVTHYIPCQLSLPLGRLPSSNGK